MPLTYRTQSRPIITTRINLSLSGEHLANPTSNYVPTLDQAVLQGGERSQPENQPRLSHSSTFFPFMVNTNSDKINFQLLKMAAKLMNCCRSNLLFISASSPSKSLHEDQGAKVKKMTPCFPIQSEDMREDEEERSSVDRYIQPIC